MLIRKHTEDIEKEILHPNAQLSSLSKGRTKPEKEDDIRTCFQRDRDRIIHSKAFRRLKHKTQVFLAPKGDHYRTRLTHVLEVSQIARTIARSLRLNEDLTEAVALGHDLGHTPFGHAGEAVLNKIHPGGFEHAKQSLRVVDFLEHDGAGLNLTQEVRDGIIKHSKGKGGAIISNNLKERPATLEGQIVRIADIIAYSNHDLDDAIRAGVIKKTDMPKKIINSIGASNAARIDKMVRNVIFTSIGTDLSQISIDNEMVNILNNLRGFLFERIYESKKIMQEFSKAEGILKALYEYYMQDDESPFKNSECKNNHRVVCDFIAGMTDRFALMEYERIFFPQRWMVL
ncbi:MAG: deoxyguanosinetriphosphate triphosphohydrolase [Dissulfurispiraceae bacterium]|jgi:dGTPase|nr:deoxyguanosinetriphosphate triphosphohydrolase [Dissulfurispiraceae bacterium]